MRIAIGCIGHETNTFSPISTDIESFVQATYCVGEEIIAEFAQTSPEPEPEELYTDVLLEA